MIRITKKALAAVPEILLNAGVTHTNLLLDKYNSGERNFASSEFNSNIYGHDEVKVELIKSQDYKCCFCESFIGHISYGDVEHFRPKAGWVQENETLNRPGYYWLAYKWDNLLLSCQKCNQRHKKNYFPLLDPAKRALSHIDNVDTEEPTFIHPAKDFPEKHITFSEEIPKAIKGDTRGKITIEKLGLDRGLLNDQRRKTLSKVRDIYDLAKMIPNIPEDKKEEARAKIMKYYKEAQQDDTEYASMLRSFFRDNPIDF